MGLHICVWILVIWCSCGGNSSVDIDNLRNPNELVLNAINKYIHDEQKRIDNVRRLVSRLISRNATAHANLATTYDPLNYYLLIKSLVNIDKLLREVNDIQNYRIITNNDYLYAAAALFRLQDTYALTTTDMANGNLSNDSNHLATTMKAKDCFDLGKLALDMDPPDYYHALLWLQEAYERLQHENPPSLEEKDLLLPLIKALYHQGNLEYALWTTMRLKDLDPHSADVDDILESSAEMQSNAMQNPDKMPPLKLKRILDRRFPDLEAYEKACRGQLKPIENAQRKLYCYYKTNKGYLKLAPFKAEVLHSDPKIVVFRNGISKMDAETVKELARAKLKRSVISTTINMDVAKYRTSKTAWLNDKDSAVIEAISKRVQEMTQLTVITAENLQVVNYELGGHYMPHFDFAGEDRNHQFANLGTGDRIATVLFYLSDTKAGGATVFPTLQLTVYPQQYDALFWYNLRPNGQGDTRTRHAACPVLVGTKWVANKWLHEYGQEFLRPCDIQEDA